MTYWVCGIDFGGRRPVIWTWFNSALVKLSPSLDTVMRGDVSPTPQKELGASRCPARLFLVPCLFCAYMRDCPERAPLPRPIGGAPGTAVQAPEANFHMEWFHLDLKKDPSENVLLLQGKWGASGQGGYWDEGYGCSCSAVGLVRVVKVI